MKKAQLLKVQVNGEVKALAIAEIKVVNPSAEPDYMKMYNQRNDLVAVIKCKQYGTKRIFSELRIAIKQAIKKQSILALDNFNIVIVNENNYVIFENTILNICEFESYCESYNANNMSDVKKAMTKKYFGELEKRLKKSIKNVKFDFDFKRYGDVKIGKVHKYRQGDYFEILAVLSCGSDIKQLSYTIDDFVFENLQEFARASHNMAFEF